MRALSIRQPFAELILRGIKRIEYRSRATSIVGERFWIYASKSRSQMSEIRSQRSASELTADLRPLTSRLTSDNLSVGTPPDWMIELAEQMKMIEPDFENLSRAVALLPRGVIVGSAVIEKVVEVGSQKSATAGLTSDLRPLTSLFAWHLADVQRVKRLRKPRRHPQPVWFRPF